MAISPSTQALIDTAFASEAAATAADAQLNTDQTQLTALTATVASDTSASMNAHQQATADAMAALRALATDFGVTLPGS